MTVIDLNNIGDSTDDIVFYVNDGKVITHWNSAAEKILNILSEEAIGQTIDNSRFEAIFDNHFRAQFEQSTQSGKTNKLFWAVSNGKNKQVFITTITPQAGGFLIWAKCQYSPIDTNSLMSGGSLPVDVFNTVDAAIYIHREDGSFIDVNEGVVKMFGYPKAYFIGKTPELFAAPGKNDMKEIRSQINKAYEGSHQKLLFWGRRADGSTFPLDVNLWGGKYFDQRVVIAFTSDISHHHKTQLELDRLRLKNETLLSTLPDMMFILDERGTFKDFRVNKSDGHLILKPSEIIGAQLIDIFDRKTTQDITALVSLALKDNKVHYYKYTIDTDNEKLYYEARFIKIDDQNAMALVRNITEMKLVEEALRVSELRYKTVFKSSPFGVAILDSGLKIISYNDKFAEIYGYKSEGMENISILQHLVNESEAYKIDFKSLSIGSGKIEKTLKSVKKDKAYFWGNYNFYKVNYSDYDPDYIVCTLEDITRVKQAEEWIQHRLLLEQLLTQVSGFSMVAESFEDFINNTLKCIGEGLEVSRTYLFKYNPETNFFRYEYEWVHKGITPFIDKGEGFTFDYIKEFADILIKNECLSVPDVDSVQSEELKAELKRQDILALQLCPVFYKDTFYGFLGFDDCLLERSWTDEDLNLLRGVSTVISHSLLHFEKEREITNLLKLTQGQNERLLNFAHIVSHNLRNHSANISMLLDLYHSEGDSNDKDVYWKMLERAANLMGDTIDQLNEVIKVNSRASKDNKWVDLNQALENVKDVLRKKVTESGAKLSKDIPEGATVPAVPAYVESVFLNLISNAIRYRHKDRVPDIRITYNISPQHHIIKVSDNGLGIDLDKYGNKVFGLYKTFHDNEDAIGLGLFMTKNQIESMNGTISIESKVGKGTTFIIKFPVLLA